MTQQDNRFYKELSSLQGGIDNQQLLDDFAKAAMQGELAEQAAIEVEGAHGKTIHGAINSEDPQWVARVNQESITSLEMELI